VTLAATPATGYRLLEFVGAPSNLTSQSVITLTGPETVTAYFSNLPSPPSNYSVTLIASGMFAVFGKSINNYGQVVGYSTSSPPRALLWTPSSPNGSNGNLMDLGSLPSNVPPRMFPTGINNYGQVVGNEQDNAGGSQSFLWQPTSANSTSGGLMTFLGAAAGNASAASGINNLGQIVGSTNQGYFLWSPSTPNGTTGTVATNGFSGAFAINDDGQLLLATGNGTVLYTPSTPNGTTGTFTTLSDMSVCLGNSIQPSQINAYGMITGWKCVSGGLIGGGGNHGAFLWTPSAANATTGTETPIPLPFGYASLQPLSLNSSGAVVGTIDQVIPFLYRGSTLYDLSALNSALAGGTAVGITDRGQIVVNANNNVYVLTPQSPPTPSTSNPQWGSGAGTTMTFTFTDPRGWQDLGVVNVLINNFIDGRNACYLAYSVPASTLYLVNDAGIAQGPYAGAIALGSGNTIQNGQCTVGLIGANGSGNTLTVSLAVTFKTAFAGNKILYLAAGDLSQNNSGWVPLGIWLWPAASQTTTTSVVAITPTSGTGLSPTPFTFKFSDTKGFADLGVENILINTALDGRHACYLAYARSINWMYIVSDSGDGLLPGASLGSSGSVSNSQCAVTWGNSVVTTNGNNLSMALNIGFSPGFGPNLIVYVAARDVNEANNTGWQASGTWLAQ
jgi:hypothetical protein